GPSTSSSSSSALKAASASSTESMSSASVTSASASGSASTAISSAAASSASTRCWMSSLFSVTIAGPRISSGLEEGDVAEDIGDEVAESGVEPGDDGHHEYDED